MFERKEHLAVGRGRVRARRLRRAPLPSGSSPTTEVKLNVARLAHRAFVVSFALALMVAVLGVAVASYKSF